MNKKIFYIGSGVAVLALLVAAFVFVRLFGQTPTPIQPSGFFGFGGSTSNTQTSGGTTNSPQAGAAPAQQVFRIATGPVAGATFIQTSNPTTTLARFVMADNGHVLDLALGVPGAAARPVSNVTIPGIQKTTWAQNGSFSIMQYSDSGVLKTLYIAFATSSSAAPTPANIKFLPDNIVSYSLSPDSTAVAYLLKTNAGVDGYTAGANGLNPKRLFSLPLSQVILSWPAQPTLLVQSKSAADSPGIALSVNVKTGNYSPLLYTLGLSANASGSFSKIMYQTSAGQSSASTYVHDTKAGLDIQLSDNPIPEKCVWDTSIPTELYCAVPASQGTGSYLDLWHQGFITTADDIFAFNSNNGIGTFIASPQAFGTNAPIEKLSVSPDGHYLLFITRSDQSLWGVRLY